MRAFYDQCHGLSKPVTGRGYARCTHLWTILLANGGRITAKPGVWVTAPEILWVLGTYLCVERASSPLTLDSGLRRKDNKRIVVATYTPSRSVPRRGTPLLDLNGAAAK